MSDDASRRHLILRISLPDRPGALGAAASRIGALGADITDVQVGRRATGTVHDTFHLDLPVSDIDMVELLLAEMLEVDGLQIESYEPSECCS